jgi:hypothetical protein
VKPNSFLSRYTNLFTIEQEQTEQTDFMPKQQDSGVDRELAWVPYNIMQSEVLQAKQYIYKTTEL